MKLRIGASASVMVLLLAGCVVVPLNRTYFEPNPDDGTPTRSASCGYHRAANDGLERDVSGVTLLVFPKYKEGDSLRVYILLRRSAKAVGLDPDKVELRVGNSVPAVRPISVEAKDAGPYFFKSITYTFTSSAGEAEDISMVLLPGFITVDGVAVTPVPFRFKKVTKMDVYYGSINC